MNEVWNYKTFLRFSQPEDWQTSEEITTTTLTPPVSLGISFDKLRCGITT